MDTKTSKMRNLSKGFFEAGIFFTILVIFGVSSSTFKEKREWLSVDPDTYETAEGTIMSSSVVYEAAQGGWQFNIIYSYKVDGKYYESNRVHCGAKGSASTDYAQKYVNNYPVGKQVLVYYDHQEPSKSVLEPNIRSYGFMYLIIILGGCALLCFCFSVFYGFKNRQEENVA